MNKCILVLITVLLFLLIGVSCGWYNSYQNSRQNQYEILFKGAEEKIKIREKKIVELEQVKKQAIEQAKYYRSEEEKASQKANEYLKQARDFKYKYMAVRDSVNHSVKDTTDVKGLIENTFDNYELTVGEQEVALLHCDSANSELQSAIEDGSKQLLQAQSNNKSKDIQIDLKTKQLKVEKNKVIALGTIGGIVFVGGLTGLIILSTLK